MRVVVNQLTTKVARTGVGHYTAQLIRHLRALAGHQIDAFPGGALSSGYRLWTVVAPYLDDVDKRTHMLSGNPFRALRTALPWITRRACQFARSSVHRRFRSVCRAGYDLYHEPNYIPLESDLPTVVTVHDLSVLLHPEWHPKGRVLRFEKAFVASLRQCQHVLTDSNFIRQQVIRTLNIAAHGVTCVHLGVRSHLGPLPEEVTAAALRQLRLTSGYLLYVGTLEPRKNLLMLMRAFGDLPSLLRDRCPLLLVGQWGWETQRERAYFTAVARHQGVRHLGYVPDRFLPALYNGARALVYPSFYEGFGLPPLEMMACGGAVLTSTAAAVREVVGSRAHFVEPDDGTAWRDALRRVIIDDDWWLSLRCGVTDLARTYTWQRCARETLRVYHSVLGRDTFRSEQIPRAA